MPTLRELERAFAAALFGSDAGAIEAMVVPDGLSPGERLSIYRNTAVLTLTRALSLAYPAVERLVGADFFATTAQSFSREQLPQSAWLDCYGAGFADFLESFTPAAGIPYLPSVARLEWAVAQALQSGECRPLDMAALGEVEPGDHCRLCFTPQPSFSLVADRHPVDTIWRAVLEGDDAAMAAIDLQSGPVRLGVRCRHGMVDVARLGGGEMAFLAQLCSGARLDEAAPAADDAAAILARGLGDGLFTAFHMAPEDASPGDRA